MLDTRFELNGTHLTVKPIGELDSMTAQAFEKDFRQHLSGVSSILVDFEQVNYISSAGLRAFLALDQTLDETGVEMKIIHVSAPIMEIFDLVGFREFITVE